MMFIRSIVRKLGFDVVRHRFPVLTRKILSEVSPYTVVSQSGINAVIESTKYIVQNDIPGAFVECGVYKGGAMMTIALSLLSDGVTDRDLYLFDTFSGMPEPEERDRDLWGKSAIKKFQQTKMSGWVKCPLDEVKKAMSSTGYPMERIHFIEGLVEDTLPENAPESVALLRLDTDFYKSTLHELIHLFPLLSSKGVLIVDDYGHFEGSRDAVNEFFETNELTPFLHRIDYAGRLVIK